MTLNAEFIEEYPPLLVTELEYNTIYRAIGSGFKDNIVMKVRHTIDEELEYILVLYSCDDSLTLGLYKTVLFNTSHFIKVQSTLTVIG